MIKIKELVLFITIGALVLCSCSNGEQSTNKVSNDGDTILISEVEKNLNLEEEKSDLNLEEEKEEDMSYYIDVTDFLTDEEVDIMRRGIVKELIVEDEEYISEKIREKEVREEVDRYYANIKWQKYSYEDLVNMMNLLYKIMRRTHPEYKPVSDELFNKRMLDVFRIKDLRSQEFRKNKNVASGRDMFICVPGGRYDGKYYFEQGEDIENNTDMKYLFVERCMTCPWIFDAKNNIVMRYFLGLSNIAEFDLWNDDKYSWGKGEYVEEKLTDLREVMTKRVPLYEKCLKQGRILMRKRTIDYVYHYNNYIFYQSKASFEWLISDEYDRKDVAGLYKYFNYDKDNDLNKLILKEIKTKAFIDNEYVGIYRKNGYGDPHLTVFGSDMYEKPALRIGMIKYIAENVYDPKDKDEYGLPWAKALQFLQDEFTYPHDDVSKYPYDGEFDYGLILAYYLQKAHDNYVAQSGSEPECWQDRFGRSLYNVEKDCESKFYKVIKEKNYYGLPSEYEDFCAKKYIETREKCLIQSTKYELMNEEN